MFWTLSIVNPNEIYYTTSRKHTVFVFRWNKAEHTIQYHRQWSERWGEGVEEWPLIFCRGRTQYLTNISGKFTASCCRLQSWMWRSVLMHICINVLFCKMEYNTSEATTSNSRDVALQKTVIFKVTFMESLPLYSALLCLNKENSLSHPHQSISCCTVKYPSPVC